MTHTVEGFENKRNICEKLMFLYLEIFTTTHVVFGLKFIYIYIYIYIYFSNKP